MDWPHLLFSPAGAVTPRAFGAGIAVVYVGALFSQALLAPAVVAQASVVPFALAQGLLLWAWYVLHAKRLSDAGRGRGAAIGMAIFLACVALVTVVLMAIFLALSPTQPTDGGLARNTVAFYAMIALIAALFGFLDLSGVTPIIFALLALMFAPSLGAFAFSIWAATRRRPLQAVPARYPGYPPQRGA